MAYPAGNNVKYLRSEKVVSRGFRTGVRLPSGPPKIKRTFVRFLFYRKSLCLGIKCILKGALVWSTAFPFGRGPLF